MGKGSKKRTSLNPTDAYRKQQRNREKKRNKQERRLVREEVLLKKNPHLIKEDLARLNHLAVIGKLDQAGYKRREKLELMWELICQRAQAEKKARAAHLEGISVKEEEDISASSKGNVEKLTVDDADSQDSSSNTSDFSSSQEESEDEEEDQYTSLTEAPPLPPGLPPSHLSKSTSLSGKQELASLHEETASIPVDFSKIINPDKPLLPPPPPPLYPEKRVSSLPEEGLGLTVIPPLPPGPPPIALTSQRAEVLSEGQQQRPTAASSISPVAMGKLPMPVYSQGGGPLLYSHPMFPYSTFPYLPTQVTSAVFPRGMVPMLSSGGSSSFEGYPPKKSTERTPSGNGTAKRVEVTPITESAASSPPSASTSPSNVSALFVPTQLRIRNKEPTKRNKFTSQKISSINQVTSFSTGIHRAGSSPFTNELTSLTEVIEHSAAQKRENKGNVAASKPMEAKDIDKAFNDFLKEVEKV